MQNQEIKCQIFPTIKGFLYTVPMVMSFMAHINCPELCSSFGLYRCSQHYFISRTIISSPLKNINYLNKSVVLGLKILEKLILNVSDVFIF